MSDLEKEIKELTRLKELINSSRSESSKIESDESLLQKICPIRKCEDCVTACDTACTTRCDTSKYIEGE